MQLRVVGHVPFGIRKVEGFPELWEAQRIVQRLQIRIILDSMTAPKGSQQRKGSPSHLAKPDQ